MDSCGWHSDELWMISREASEHEPSLKRRGMGIPLSSMFRRTPEERLLDAIFFPEIKFHEMTD